MARLTPEQYAAKWQTRTKAAAPDMAAGIDRVTVAPGMSAAKQSGLMLAKLQESVTSGAWARRVSAVSVDDWKSAAKTKGVQRVAAGVDSAMRSQVAMATQLLADVDAVVAEVNRTPRGDLETNIGRMGTYARGMHARSRARR